MRVCDFIIFEIQYGQLRMYMISTVKIRREINEVGSVITQVQALPRVPTRQQDLKYNKITNSHYFQDPYSPF